MSRRGFTFVELIAVIFCIFVGAALFLPIFTHGHHPGSARKSACQNNLKQIAMGFMQYTQDYDEHFPSSCVVNRVHPDRGDRVAAVTWDELISPYIESAMVFRCPSDPLPKDVPARTYAANAWVMGVGYCHPHWLPGAPRYGLAARDVKEPGSTFLFAERWDDDRRRVLGRADYHITWDEPRHRNASHLDGANYAFVDGHVKWQPNGRPMPGYRWR